MKKALLFLAILTIFATGTYAQLTLPITDNFPSSGAEQSWSDYDSPYEDIQAFSPSAPSGDGYVAIWSVSDARKREEAQKH